jgi:hypothetical protein
MDAAARDHAAAGGNHPERTGLDQFVGDHGYDHHVACNNHINFVTCY